MSDWAIIVPEATTNKVLNPSAETTANFAAHAGTTVDRSTTYSFRGRYSYRVQANANGEGVDFTLSALSNAIHYATLLVRGTLPAPWVWSLDGATFTAPALLDAYGDWSLYGLQFPAAQSNGSTTLTVQQSDADAADYYIDAIQVEQKEYWTTYCDGDQEGCQWSGAVHASTSTRSAQSRAGGRVIDLEDYGVTVLAKSGHGLPPLAHNVTDQALLPGALLQSLKVRPRLLTLTMLAAGSTMAALHGQRKDLIDAIKPDLVTPLQPVRLRYSGAGSPVEIAAYYDSGLDGMVSVANTELFACRLIAYDPYFRELGETAVTLGVRQTLAVGLVAGKIDYQWNAMGAPAATNPGGGAFGIRAIAVGPDQKVYVAGDFLNWDGQAAGDYIACWDGTSWLSLGGANNTVLCLAIGPDGSLYAGGNFTSIGGVGAIRIARWNGSTWAQLTAEIVNSRIESLVFGPDGTLYAGGAFNMIGALAVNYIAKWNGATWAVVTAGAGFDSYVYALAIGLDGTVYAGGVFHSADGDGTIQHIAKSTDGAAWAMVGSAVPNNDVYSLATGEDGTIYAGGLFTTIGGISANRIARWNGSAWAALGSGANNYVYTILPDESRVYIGGMFTSVGGLALADAVALWNGSAWMPLDIDLPGSINVRGMALDARGRLFLGYEVTGNAYTSVATAVTNGGTVAVHPKIIIKRAGGTSATLQLLCNATTGQVVYLNYALLDGETLTIDLDYQPDPTKPASITPGRKRITSSFFGDVIGRALLPYSDFAALQLLPGANTLVLYVSEAGAPTMTAYLTFRPAHWSADGVAA